MKKSILLFVITCCLPVASFSQQADALINKQVSVKELMKNMKQLVALNSAENTATNLSTIDAINLQNATVSQLIQVTKPYFQSTPHIKYLCQALLTHALFGQVKNEKEKQAVIEILCGHFLTNENIPYINTSLALLTKKDFNKKAKKYISVFIENDSVNDLGLSAQLLSVAQITKSIPFLWKVVDTSFKNMQHKDIDILVSLARMDEKKAGNLLVAYYQSRYNIWGDSSSKKGEYFRHYIIAKKMAFSLDRTVLNCLIEEFREMDINYTFRDGDTGFYPAQYVGACIASMLKNYPYQKESYSLNPSQLKAWLATNEIVIKDK